MFSFKQTVLSKVDDVFVSAKDEHSILGPDGYKIAVTSLLGFTPTNWETEDVFKNRSGLNLQEFREIVLNKLKYFHIEQYATEIFALFDEDFKGYVTINDLQRVWNIYNLKTPWCKIEESFRNVSKNGMLDYALFYEIITDTNQNFAMKNLIMYK